MISQRAIELSVGDVTPAAALETFSRAFADLVERRVIVTAFPEAGDANILVFRYLLDAVTTAATAPKFERRHFTHSRILERIAYRLGQDGRKSCEAVVEGIMAGCVSVDRTSGEYIAAQRLAYVKRMLDFSMGLVLEMDAKGLWPSCEPVDLYRSLHDTATRSVALPVYCLEEPDMLAAVARSVDPASSEAVLAFRGWKPY